MTAESARVTWLRVKRHSRLSAVMMSSSQESETTHRATCPGGACTSNTSPQSTAVMSASSEKPRSLPSKYWYRGMGSESTSSSPFSSNSRTMLVITKSAMVNTAKNRSMAARKLLWNAALSATAISAMNCDSPKPMTMKATISHTRRLRMASRNVYRAMVKIFDSRMCMASSTTNIQYDKAT